MRVTPAPGSGQTPQTASVAATRNLKLGRRATVAWQGREPRVQEPVSRRVS